MQFKGEKLKRLLAEKEWSLQKLANETGKSKSYWGQVTSGVKKNLHRDTVEVLCNTLKINEDYFYLEDSRLIQDVIPDLPPELIDFIMNGENTAWLQLSVNAKKEGLSPNTVQKILNALKEEKDSN